MQCPAYSEIIQDDALTVKALSLTQVTVEPLFSAHRIVKSDLRAAMMPGPVRCDLFKEPVQFKYQSQNRESNF